MCCAPFGDDIRNFSHFLEAALGMIRMHLSERMDVYYMGIIYFA